MPGNDHAHDSGLTGASRHFAGKPIKAGIGFGVCLLDLLAEPLGSHFGQIDQRLHCFALAKEQPTGARGVAPMQEKALRLGGDAPLAWRKAAPLVHMLADFINKGVRGDLGPILIE